MQVITKLHSNTKDVSQLRQYVVTSYEHDEVIVTAKLPESGKYALNVYAKEDTVDGTFTNLCRYVGNVVISCWCCCIFIRIVRFMKAIYS